MSPGEENGERSLSPIKKKELREMTKMTKIINLTPHPINLVGFGEIPPSGIVARLEERTEMFGKLEGIPIIRKRFGRIIGLPEPQEDTYFIVSLPVAQAARRADVFAIGEYVRDEKGNVVGAKSLATFV